MQKTVVFEGPDQILTFNLIALKAALRMYVNHKMLANRRLTPMKMLMLSGQATGKMYRRGQHAIALKDIEAMVEERKKRHEDSQT